MDGGTIFLGLGLLILVSLYVGRPFLERRSVPENQVEQEYSALLAERERILEALNELDFDHYLGKIPAGEYPFQRTALLERGAKILRQLDAFLEADPAKDIDSRLEAAISARREARLHASSLITTSPVSTQPITDPDDELEALIAMRKRSREEAAAGFCPHCGQPVTTVDRFCAKCGATLEQAPA